MEKIINYDWEDIITRVLEGIRNFVEKFQKFFPKSYYNFEKPETYKVD